MFHVKQNHLLHNLIHFLKTQNIILNDIQIQQLELYRSEIKMFADKMNLISSRDKGFLIEHHFLPSFYYLYYMQKDSQLSNKQILDIGTGAGLPGIILSIALPDSKIVLIDSSRKKTLFLKMLVSKLNLRADVICERIENLDTGPLTGFDIIVARAVASIPVLHDWCRPFLGRSSYLLTLKGDNYKEELNNRFDIKFYELVPSRSWCDFSNYLFKKCMIKIFNN